MKLNAAAELQLVSWPAFAHCILAPADQAQGYRRLADDLEQWLAALTGFAVSLQLNAGSQGEYAGLLVIAPGTAPAESPSRHLSDPHQCPWHQPRRDGRPQGGGCGL